MENKSASKIICSICYEDLKPGAEDLQAVSVCGHVFHELCLQQWLEYCPSNKKATCPVCKSVCSGTNVHRLFFQSLSDSSQSTQQLPASADSQVLQESVCRLEGQLSVATSTVQQQQQEIIKLTDQLHSSKKLSEKVEIGRTKALKEKVQMEGLLQARQEELNKSTAECTKLLERNMALAKELAAHKLVANLDLQEDQIQKLASVGHGSNKDEIIDTLRKSLVIRNKSYKALMEKCNQLGIGDNQSQRKFDKAADKIRKLKARVQKLEKILEEKENSWLRSLVKKDGSRREVEVAVNKFQEMPLCDRELNSALNKSSSQQNIHDLSSDELLECTGKHVNLTSQLKNGHIDSDSLKSSVNMKNDSLHNDINEGASIKQLDFDTALKPANKLDFASEVSSGGMETNENVGRVAISNFETKVEKQSYFKSARQGDSTMDHDLAETSEVEFTGIMDANAFLPIKKELGGMTVSNSCPNNQENIPGSSILLNGVPKRWGKEGSGLGHKAQSSGSYVAVGANGRGGQIKVLRNTQFSLESRPTLSVIREAKRFKAAAKKPVPEAGRGLQIEHFFHKASSK